jgi:hypothetical protein
MQIHIPGPPPAENTPPPNKGAQKNNQHLVLNLGVWPPAVTSSSLFPSRRLRKQYTHPTPTANPPTQGVETPPLRAQSRHRHPKPGAAVARGFCATRHVDLDRLDHRRQARSPVTSSIAGRVKRKRPATKRLPAFLKQLESAVLDYQEDLVMPGSSPR